MKEHNERLALARETLEGLSVGDAVGEALSYGHHNARKSCDFSSFREGTLPYTDDTEMAIAVYETLSVTQRVKPDTLAMAFSIRFQRDPGRGYGKMTRRILAQIGKGEHWETLSKGSFSGGSFGNGAAMRVGPLGAYFADNIESIPGSATNSAKVTHYHPEGIAGAVAVAVACGAAVQVRGREGEEVGNHIWQAVMDHTPDGKVKLGLELAKSLQGATADEAAKKLGNGTEISAPDTVPFCVWNACRCIGDFKEAIISTVEVGGDCDTNAAIVGGIVASYCGVESLPESWMKVREKLDIRL